MLNTDNYQKQQNPNLLINTITYQDLNRSSTNFELKKDANIKCGAKKGVGNVVMFNAKNDF
jgi:hypothetical protein